MIQQFDCGAYGEDRCMAGMVCSRKGLYVKTDDFETLQAESKRLQQENKRLRDALTPSEETKAAFIGEFSIKTPYEDEDGNWSVHPSIVPWVVIREVMKKIRCLANVDGDE